MSEANVDVIQRGFDAFNARDLDALLALTDPDCVWLPFRAQLEGGVYREHAGVRRFMDDMEADWETFRIDPVEFHPSGDRVAVVGRVQALGRGSGVEVDSQAGFVYELRAGLIVRLESFSDPAAALDALGG